MNKKLLVLITLATLPCYAIAEEIRNPFAPFPWDAPAQETGGTPDASKSSIPDAPPLLRDPIYFYKLAGVIISPTDSIALIRTKSKLDFFVKVGETVGNEGGVISKISTEGITVDVNGKPIDLTVSNRLDIQNESN
jgi:Tfp pilus assembly protein PilP